MDINNLGSSLSKLKESFIRPDPAPVKAATTQPLDPKVLMAWDESKIKESALDRLNSYAASLESPLDEPENSTAPLKEKALHYFDGLHRGEEVKQNFLKLTPEKQASFCRDFEASLDPDLENIGGRAVQRVSMCFDLLKTVPPKLSAREAATVDYLKDFGEGDALKQRFLMLPKEQRAQFCNVLDSLAGNPGAQVAFASILTNEKSWEMKDQADPKLFGVLSNLNRIAQGELSPKLKKLGMDKKEMMGTLVEQICFEGSVFQGKDTDTCSAASLQANLANTDPAEYARIAAGIMLDGEVKIHGGQTLTLSTSETGKNDGGRSDFDDVMQGTFVSFGRKFEAVGSDYFGGRGGPGGSMRGKVGQGLTANQILNMNQFITGEPSVIVVVNPENRQKLIDAMREATKAGYNVTVGQDGHALDISKISQDPKWGDYIDYFDSLTGGGGGSPASSFGDIEVAILPAKFAESFEKSDLIDQGDFGGRGGSGGSAR
ncbi:MAG TPA: hypothetical protein V6C82_03405 [Chroococcales cyanobacterium]|jgi:hypothetical protein